MPGTAACDFVLSVLSLLSRELSLPRSPTDLRAGGPFSALSVEP